MGNDEAALVRLWGEKRGEAEPEDLADNLIVQARDGHRGPQPALVPAQYRPRQQGRAAAGPAPSPQVDGGDPTSDIESPLSHLEYVHGEAIGVNLAIHIGPKAVHPIALDTFDCHQWSS